MLKNSLPTHGENGLGDLQLLTFYSYVGPHKPSWRYDPPVIYCSK